MPEKPWHVIRGWPQHDRKNYDALTAAGRSVFFPRWEVSKTLLGKRTTVIERMSAGTLFVRFLEETAHEWHAVRELCGGGISFLGGEYPTSVLDSALEPLRGRGADPTGLMPTPTEDKVEVEYKAGDLVRIIGLFDPPILGVVSWSDRHGARIVPKAGAGLFRELYILHSARMLEKLSRRETNEMRAPQYGRRRFAQPAFELA